MGSTPTMHSEFTLDPSVKAGVSLEKTTELKTSNERNNMKKETKVKYSAKLNVRMNTSLVLVILGLLGFGAGPVPPLA